MNLKRQIKSSLQGKESNNHMKTVAIIGGIAVGIAIGALFATKKGRKIKGQILSYAEDLVHHLMDQKTGKNAAEQLGNLVDNVRDHVKKSAEGLLGEEKGRKNPSEIKVENAGTTAWKSTQEKTDFPGTIEAAN